MDVSLVAYVGAAIKRHRAEKGLSQVDLASRAEVDRSHLSEIENGRKNVSISVLEQIAAALGVASSELLQGYDRPK